VFHARDSATGNARSPSKDRRMVGTTTEHGGTQSLARMNLGHEPEVLREIIRAETMKTAIMYCIQTAEDIVKLISRPR